MIEIIVLIFLCYRMGRLMREKGRPALRYQIFVPVSWIGGAFLGVLLHASVHGLPNPEGGISLFQYLLALLGSVFCVGVLFIHAQGLPALDGNDADDNQSNDVRNWRE